MTPPHRRWSHLTTADFDTDTSGWIAILPIAATEQHGPHLPTGTDTMIGEGLLEHAIARFPDDLPALVLPTLAVGKSDEHDGFAGTLSLDAKTLIDVLEAYGDSVARAGLRKLVILNSHGGNSEAMGIAGRALRIRHRMLVVATSWARLGYPAGLFPDDEIAHGIHAGDVETSLMLALEPGLVRQDRCGDFVPASVSMVDEFAVLRGHGRMAFSWILKDLSETGACGDASAATARKGEAAADYAVGQFLGLLYDVHRFDPARMAG